MSRKDDVERPESKRQKMKKKGMKEYETDARASERGDQFRGELANIPGDKYTQSGSTGVPF
jgi:hypothetical protein